MLKGCHQPTKVASDGGIQWNQPKAKKKPTKIGHFAWLENGGIRFHLLGKKVKEEGSPKSNGGKDPGW